MQAVDRNALRYDGRTIAFHWVTLFLVIAQFAVAWTIDDFPRGKLRVDARSVHIVLGAVLAVVVVARLAWRATGGRRLPPADRGALHAVAKATHWGLYSVVAAMVSAGVFLAWARGDSVFNLITIPKFDPFDDGIRHRAQWLHATIGWVLIALVGLHAAAAVVHRIVWRDGVLGRMAPRCESRAKDVRNGPRAGAAGGD